MSNFAENQLKKYGWNEGEGIGRTNQGIVKPIKASLKFDNSGVGYDIADEFNINWWEHLYNHTAKKIDPTSSKNNNKEENISIKIIPESNVSNSNVLNKKSLFYARFQKSSLLVDGQTVKVDEPEVKPVKKEDSYDKKGKKIVSDEDLFKLCEGRTAHKGARHGIKMNGKLARLEEQELNFKQISENKRKLDENTQANEENESKTKKKKKSKNNKE